MRAVLAAIALLCLMQPTAAQGLQVYQTCGISQQTLDEIVAKIGAKHLPDITANEFLRVFNHATPETHYTGPVVYKDRPEKDALEFIVKDGETYCLFGVEGDLRKAIRIRFEGSPA